MYKRQEPLHGLRGLAGRETVEELSEGGAEGLGGGYGDVHPVILRGARCRGVRRHRTAMAIRVPTSARGALSGCLRTGCTVFASSTTNVSVAGSRTSEVPVKPV